MLELRFLAEPSASPEISLRAQSLCVSGGVVHIEMNSTADITYSHGMWAYRRRMFRMLEVTGSLYLAFGIAREPTIVSHPIDHFHFIGPTISTDGVGIAKYSEHQRHLAWTAAPDVVGIHAHRDITVPGRGFKVEVRRPRRAAI